MKPLKPRTLIVGGPLGILFATAIASFVASPNREGLIVGTGCAVIMAIVIGVPLFGAMAWAGRFAQRAATCSGEQKASSRKLSERIKLIAIGANAAGCAMTYLAFNADEGAMKLPFQIACAGLVGIAILVAATVTTANCALVRYRCNDQSEKR